MQISKAELRNLVQEAEQAFWQVVVARYPQAKTGDLSIDMTFRLSMAAENAIEEWIYLNVPTATK
jgi:hypothetical protein